MKTSKPPTALQMTHTTFGLAVRYEGGRIILARVVGDKIQWEEITPRWHEDGTLIRDV